MLHEQQKVRFKVSEEFSNLNHVKCFCLKHESSRRDTPHGSQVKSTAFALPLIVAKGGKHTRTTGTTVRTLKLSNALIYRVSSFR